MQTKKNFAKLRQDFQRYLSANDNITNLSKTFGALNSNTQRVDFVLKLLEEAKIDVAFEKDTKNNQLASKLRLEGNEMFKTKKLKNAWELYTRSLTYAEENSENLGLAYANRSAVLFELNLHDDCLKDIARAFASNYPPHLEAKLSQRQKNSESSRNAASEAPHEAVPCLPASNARIQCASDALEIAESASFGRFVAAARDIEIGEILAIEAPFALLVVNQTLCHCHECASLCYSLIPCRSCTQALYCSEACRDEAFRNYHQSECAILATINSLELDKLKVLPLKIAFKARNRGECDGDDYRSGRYEEIHNLVTNCEKRSVADLFERATAAALIYRVVEEHACVGESFKELLLLHMQTGPSNFHEITELARADSNTFEPDEIASGAFAFLSLLNHSCCPNVTRFCYGSRIVLRAIQDIEKGEQCFDNYGYHFAVMSRKDRQRNLKNQYYFDCICQACMNDWPLYDNLPLIGSDEIDDSLMVKLSSGDVEAAQQVLNQLLPKLQVLQKTQPCKDFCKLQEIIKQCFALLGNKRRIF